jgi:hypothetical protein
MEEKPIKFSAQESAWHVVFFTKVNLITKFTPGGSRN